MRAHLSCQEYIFLQLLLAIRIAIANSGRKNSLAQLSTAQRVNSALPIDRNSILILKSQLHHCQPFPYQFLAQLLTSKKSSSLVMTEQSKDHLTLLSSETLRRCMVLLHE
jgi:hypothetical protein